MQIYKRQTEQTGQPGRFGAASRRVKPGAGALAARDCPRVALGLVRQLRMWRPPLCAASSMPPPGLVDLEPLSARTWRRIEDGILGHLGEDDGAAQALRDGERSLLH